MLNSSVEWIHNPKYWVTIKIGLILIWYWNMISIYYCEQTMYVAICQDLSMYQRVCICCVLGQKSHFTLEKRQDRPNNKKNLYFCYLKFYLFFYVFLQIWSWNVEFIRTRIVEQNLNRYNSNDTQPYWTTLVLGVAGNVYYTHYSALLEAPSLSVNQAYIN